MGVRYEQKGNHVLIANGHRLQANAHLHSHLEIVYMIEGNARAWIDDVCYELQTGDLFVAFPNQVHHYDTIGYENYILVIFPMEFCQEYNAWFKNYVPKSPLLHLPTDERADVVSLLIQLYAVRETAEDEVGQAIRKGYLLAFLGRLIRKMEFVEEKSGEILVLRQLLNYCAQNYNQDLSLDVLEKELHVNRYYISHLFSQKLKMGFNNYVKSLRIEQACRLLQNTDKNITDILREVGFATPRTFNRAFYQIMGETPSQYRKNIAKNI